MIACAHAQSKKFGTDRKGNPRHRCTLCGKTWTDRPTNPLGDMRIDLDKAKLALRLLVEGNSIRATERIAGIDRNTVCKLLVLFGNACQRFLDRRMRGLTLSHLQFDEQWTFVAKKQSRLTTIERAESYDQGDIYLWTCIDQKTKLMPSFLIGKRSADNARRFLMDVAGRLTFPNPHASDSHSFKLGEYPTVVQISTDAFSGYREAVDLAFGPYAKYGTIIKEYRNAKMIYPYAKYGTIIKEYRNAKMIYTPSEMVGTKRKGIRGIGPKQEWSITTSHVERLNGTQRLFLKRLNRLTYCFSKKLRNLEAAFGMFAAYYNFCWQTRMPGKSGKKRGTAGMMAKITGHVWSFDELFAAVLAL